MLHKIFSKKFSEAFTYIWRCDKNNVLDSAIRLVYEAWIISNLSNHRCWHTTHWRSDMWINSGNWTLISLQRRHTMEEKAPCHSQETWILVMAFSCVTLHKVRNLSEPQHLHQVKRRTFTIFLTIIFHYIFTLYSFMIKDQKLWIVPYIEFQVS